MHAPRKNLSVLPNPIVIRSRLVLEIASEMAGSGPQRNFGQAKVYLRQQGTKDWPVCLFSSNTAEGIEAVVKREADLAIVNPATPLTIAYRGTGPYKSPQPVRMIGVIPSEDEFVFAVRKDAGIATLEDIGRKRFPLRASLRGQPDHCIHQMLDDILAACGFSLTDIKSWGGAVRYEGHMPMPDGPKFDAFAKGEIDAIFDEASDVWTNEAVEAGMTVLPLEEETARMLEAIGYRRAVLRKAVFPSLPGDVLTIDFSGWPVFAHAEAPDALVTQICAALESRKGSIPWQGEGALPIERMCREARDTPQDVPLHGAAERYWRSRGFLP